MNGNAVRLNGQTRITGDYYNWWYTEADAAFYFNNTREDLSGWYHSNTLGGELDLGYTPTLQTYGAGQYYQSTVHDAYTPDCTYGGSSNTFSAMCAAWPAHCNIPPPWNSSSSINISRPTRPDYGTAGHPVYYLGPGIASDHAYSNNTSLIAGNANGAPPKRRSGCSRLAHSLELLAAKAYRHATNPYSPRRSAALGALPTT
jgi:hypothetical protein